MYQRLMTRYFSKSARKGLAVVKSPFSALKIRDYATPSKQNKDVLRIVLVGPPGCGKGTQASKIQRDFGPVPISTGHLLRMAAEHDPAIKKTIEKGELVSDDTVLKLVRDYLSREPLAAGWQLDGYPRTVKQAEDLDKLLAEIHQQLTCVLFIKVEDEAIIERTALRWVHTPSGRTYHLTYNPPKVAGKDDVTGEPLVQREDDKRDFVIERLKQYRKHTQPVLDYYQSRGLLEVIDSPTSDIGYPKIKHALAARLHHKKSKL
jgi:adenylate kinase